MKVFIVGQGILAKTSERHSKNILFFEAASDMLAVAIYQKADIVFIEESALNSECDVQYMLTYLNMDPLFIVVGSPHSCNNKICYIK